MAVRAALQPMVGGSLAIPILARLFDDCKCYFVVLSFLGILAGRYPII